MEQGKTAPSKHSRYVHLDALRALAVLLLVFFHATGYLILRRETTDVGTGFRWFVHVFHMPLFFVLSGFVLGLAVHRSGARAQIDSRIRRLGIPFAIGMVTVIPAIRLVGIWFSSMKAGPTKAQDRLTLGNIFSTSPQHLWFLEYLLLISVIALIVWALWRGTAAARERREERLPSGLLAATTLLLMLAPALMVLLDGRWEASYQPYTMVPNLPLFLYYSCFFVVGWLLTIESRFQVTVEAAPLTKLVVGVALASGAYAIFLQHDPLSEHGLWPRAPVVIASTVAAWCLISGAWGLAARLVHDEPWVRWASDSSYWLYIVHLPILVLIESALARTSMPLLPRWIGAIVATVCICSLSYAVFVRGRFLGRLLGERAPQPRSVSKRQDSLLVSERPVGG